MRVTVESLKELGASGECYDLAKFEHEWPDGVEVSLEALLRAAELGLGFKWWGHRVLSGAAREKFEEDTAPALAKFTKAIDPAWAKYTKDTAPAWKTYEEDIAPARAKFEEDTAPAWKAYQKATASALWEALQS